MRDHVERLTPNVPRHLIEACNARCTYCFATFPHLAKKDRLSDSDQERLIDLLVDFPVGKINFAGGEPTWSADWEPCAGASRSAVEESAQRLWSPTASTFES